MNYLIVSLKRMLSRKLYLGLLLFLMALTILYQLLPVQSRSTEIRAAVCLEDDSSYTDALKKELHDSASLYQFYYVSSKDSLIEDVQSGYAECGFYVPESFFEQYIAGTCENKIEQYETPESTLSATICETLFHFIFKVTSPQILVNTIGDSSLNAELETRMHEYMTSDTIFRMSSVTNGAYDYKENSYRMNLPIREVSCLLLLFSVLFGLMIFFEDRERGIYIALPARQQFSIQCAMLCASILPAYTIGMGCNLIAYGTAHLLDVSLVAVLSTLFATSLSFVLKKSRTLAKLLPLLLFLAIVYFFLSYLM